VHVDSAHESVLVSQYEIGGNVDEHRSVDGWEPSALAFTHALRGVALRPVLPSDFDFLYQLATDDPQAWRWRFRGALPPASEFVSVFYQDVAAAFVVCSASDGRLLGQAVSYGLNLRDGIANVAVQVAHERIGRGSGFIAATLRCNYLFVRWPVRRLYFEVPSYNLHQIGSTVGTYLKEEGRLRDHVYFDGSYHDLHILVADREATARAIALLSRSTKEVGS
jgi:RimJ/RimL family protein N-acetyltransferase